ncbi:MAG: T9SS type A sorting domain-containing protein [Cyclobacteriaceae bacterium]
MRNKLIILSFALFFSLVGYTQGEDESVVSAERTIVVEPFNVTNKIELYPNPAVDFVVVSISQSTLKKVEFELHSIIGNEIKIHPEEMGNGKFKIPLKDFASGYYFIVVKDEVSRFKQAYKFLKN